MTTALLIVCATIVAILALGVLAGRGTKTPRLCYFAQAHVEIDGREVGRNACTGQTGYVFLSRIVGLNGAEVCSGHISAMHELEKEAAESIGFWRVPR